MNDKDTCAPIVLMRCGGSPFRLENILEERQEKTREEKRSRQIAPAETRFLKPRHHPSRQAAGDREHRRKVNIHQ